MIAYWELHPSRPSILATSSVLLYTRGTQGKRASQNRHPYLLNEIALGIATKTLRTPPPKKNRGFRPILRCRHRLLRRS
eukprot:4242110-Prymnesium_polylepis.1